MEIFVQNLRSFAEPVRAELRPLTLVVGENSSGKTSFLGAIHSMLSNYEFPFRIDFNNPPFALGSYRTIATRKPGATVPVKSFQLGYSDLGTEVRAQFVSRAGRPHVSLVTVRTANWDIRAERKSSNSYTVYVTVTLTNGETREYKKDVQAGPIGTWHEVNFRFLYEEVYNDLVKASSHDEARALLEEASIPHQPAPFAVAPVRSKARRTYDSEPASPSAEGGEVPFRIATLRRKANINKSLFDAIRSFGSESGLFDDLRIRRLGPFDGDPFQVFVQKNGIESNLTDVGYGVGQVLPVIFNTLRLSTRARLILQQPEVHLHPRAQASLGSLFASVAASLTGGFVLIETHSDYLLDRVRLEVARGLLAPEKVVILFCELNEGVTKLHSINLDQDGNVIDAPACYREFFLEEEVRMLTRADLGGS